MKVTVTTLVAGLLLATVVRSVAAGVSTPDEQAAFLAGIPLQPQSPLAGAQQGEAYKEHQRELTDKWAFCRKARYDAMQKWGEEHLRKLKGQDVVRYLFGGPDFLNAYAFFPNARTMVLGGLEPVGEVPPPENLKPGSLAPALSSLRQSLRTSLYCGYFITSEMGGQLHQGSFRGVLPVLYTELALTGNHVDSVDFEKPFGSPGVRITYHRPGHSQQTLYYFQANLANGQECGRFLSWLGGLGNGATYLKAASYLLHGSEFSQTRDFLLKTSTLVVEDDSGIPYHAFAKGGWNIQLFGEYASPLPIFSGYTQRDFREAYKTSQYAGPIPFGAGYHVVPAHANILLACSGTPANPPKPLTDPEVARRDQEAAQAEADLLGSLHIAGKKDQPKPVAVATPVSKQNGTSRAGIIAEPKATPSVSTDRKSLAALEDEELHIRQDSSLSKAERSVRLQEVWNRQLVAMGKSPIYKVSPPLAKPAPVSAEKTQATPSPTPAPTPSLTPSTAAEAVPAPTPSSSPVATPVPAAEPSSSAQPTASPVASPSSQG
jgi:hypothetical protein